MAWVTIMINLQIPFNATLGFALFYLRDSAGIGRDFSYVPRGNSIYIYAIIINDDVGNLATYKLASGSGLRRLVNGDFYSSIHQNCLRKSSLSLAIYRHR